MIEGNSGPGLDIIQRILGETRFGVVGPRALASDWKRTEEGQVSSQSAEQPVLDVPAATVYRDGSLDSEPNGWI